MDILSFDIQAGEILESISDGFFALDANMHFVYINKRAEPLLGSKREFIIGKNIWSVIPEESSSGMKRQVHLALETGKPVHFEEYFAPNETWYEFRGYPNENGLSVYFSDITERIKKQQEKEDLLKKSQEFTTLHDAMFENAPLGLALFDKHMRFDRVNEALEKITGLKEAELKGKTAAEALPGVSRRFQESLFKVYETGTDVISQVLPVETPAHPGETKYWSVTYYPITIKNETICVGAFFEEITERRHWEQRLTESEIQFKTIGESIPFGVWVTDADGGLQFLNESYLNMVGMTLEEAKPFGWLSKVSDPQRDELKERWMETVNAGSNWDYEYNVNGADGKLYTVLSHGRPIKDENGVVRKWVGIHLDITERKQIETRLQKSEDRLVMAQHAAKMGLFDWNIQENKNYFSQEYKNLWGREINTAEDFMNAVHPDDRDRIDAEVKSSYETGKFISDFRIRRPDGKECWIHARANITYDENGKPLSLLGINMDISDAKQLDQKKDEFISIAGHELRTPLTTVKGYMQLIEKTIHKKEYDKIGDYMKIANVNINKLNILITDLLDIGRVQAGKMNYVMEDFSADEMITETIQSVQRTTESHNIRQKGKAYAQLHGDKQRIEQVLTNFLTNAIKYSPGEKYVDVIVSREEGGIKISVKDYGIGIPEEHQHKVFKRFYRVEDEAINFTGLGIGLFISEQIIQKHKGTIGVKSKPGKGSEFFFTLPI